MTHQKTNGAPGRRLDPKLQHHLEAHARRFGDRSCPICNGLGHIIDPQGGGIAHGAFLLCECLKKGAKADAPPYIYYDEASNSMLPCPSREGRIAIERMNLLMNQSGIPGRYLWKFISSIEVNTPMKPGELNTPLVLALDHAVDAIHNYGTGKIQGLYLHGPTGTGKTLLSCAVLNELVRLYQAPIRYAKISRDVLGKLRASFNPNSEIYGEGRKIEEELATVDALVIDDFGVHRESDWVNSVLYDLIDARYENNLLTIITSNDPLDSIRSIFHGRVYSRIREMCTEIHMDTTDFRQVHSKQY